jgi:broad specificity phosphatase PhoE
MERLLFIRHGQTASNVLGLLDTAAPGPELTELGHAQAAAIPAALRGRAVSSITVSNLTRTAQTARPLAIDRRLELIVEDGVGEISAGEFEMQGGAEAFEIYTGAAWAWSRGMLDLRVPGAENGHEFFARFDDAVGRVMGRGGELPVIVSHAGSIRVWVGLRSENVPHHFAADSPLHNTGSALLSRGAGGKWELVEWNADPLGGNVLSGPSGPDPTGS